VNNRSIAKKCFIELVGGLRRLRGLFSVKKQNYFMFFYISRKYFLPRIFLVIGVKPGKSLGMGEKIKAAKPESGEVEKE